VIDWYKSSTCRVNIRSLACPLARSLHYSLRPVSL